MNNPQIEYLQGVISELQTLIDANKDNRTKTIGDRVLLWDYSGCISTTGVEHHKFTGLDGIEAIVIQTNCNKAHQGTFSLVSRNLDLLLLFPNGERVYTCSEFVKRTDNYK